MTDPRPRVSTGLAQSLARFRERYGRLLEWVVSALMIVLAVEVTAGVIFRAAGHSLIWYDEVASVLLAWLTFYGAALASVKRAHIGCPEVVEKLPWTARRVTNIVAQVLVIAFFLLLAAVGMWVLPVLATDQHGEPARDPDQRRAVGDSDRGNSDRRRRVHAPGRSRHRPRAAREDRRHVAGRRFALMHRAAVK